jgi:hypothetical protein
MDFTDCPSEGPAHERPPAQVDPAQVTSSDTPADGDPHSVQDALSLCTTSEWKRKARAGSSGYEKFLKCSSTMGASSLPGAPLGDDGKGDDGDAEKLEELHVEDLEWKLLSSSAEQCSQAFAVLSTEDGRGVHGTLGFRVEARNEFQALMARYSKGEMELRGAALFGYDNKNMVPKILDERMYELLFKVQYERE